MLALAAVASLATANVYAGLGVVEGERYGAAWNCSKYRSSKKSRNTTSRDGGSIGQRFDTRLSVYEC